MKNIKKYIKNNPTNTMIILFSFLAFIVGVFAIGFIKSFIIIGIIDAFVLLPSILNKKKKTKKKSNNKTKKQRKKILKIITISILSFIVLIFIGSFIFIAIIIKDAPTFSPENLYRQESSYIIDMNGETQAVIGEEKREKLNYDELPEVLINAIVATEDANFFEHNGFDLKRFLVASFKQLFNSSGGGASTLTMQISKKNYTSNIDSGFEGIKRKFTDIYMSIFKIEKKYTKEEIMEFYVNSEYLGSYSYGVEQASLTYFNKSAKDLTLAEAALIAGLYQAPGAYDPNKHPEAAEKRRKQVLYLMHRHGYITKEEKEIAELQSVDRLLVKSSSTGNSDKFAAFTDTVRDEVMEITKELNPDGIDPTKVSMKIYTTLNPQKQEYIDKIMSGETFEWENDQVDAGITIVDVKTGAIVAVGAGRNRSVARDFNTATHTKKQIGSSAKPLYDYAPGIEYLNWSTYTLFGDEPHSYSTGQSISNWDNKFNGLLTLRTSLKESRNIPALKAFKANDNNKIKNFVTSLGLNPQIENGKLFEAHSLGAYTGESPYSMAGAYATFANGGYYTKPYTITKIEFTDSGEIFEPKHIKTKVMSEETAYIISNLLIDSGKWGLYPYANVNNATFGAKTGTTNYDDTVWKNSKYKNYPSNAVNDLWISGISPDYSITLWYGYKELNEKYTNTLGKTDPRRLFQIVAKEFFKSGSKWTQPKGVAAIEVEKNTWPAMLPSEFTPDNMKITELFKKGSEPTEISPRYKQLDNVKNLVIKEENNKLNLTWNAVENNSYNDVNLLKKQLSSILLNSTYLDATASSIINNSNLGIIKYNIYLKDTAGKLTLIGSTEKNNFSYTPTSNSKLSFVVKTTYENYSKNMSEGSEASITPTKVQDIITADLIGNKTLTYGVGDSIKDSDYDKSSISVKNSGIDVIKDENLKITTTITNLTNGNSVSKITTSSTEKYLITYVVTYNNKLVTTLTRNVNIEKQD